MSKKKKVILVSVFIFVVILVVALFNFENILNFYLEHTMGKNYPQLNGEPKIGEMYAIDIDGAVSSDGSKWQGYFKKGSENKVIVYFYGGGVSTNEYTAIRSMDVEGGFYNPRMNTGLNVMTSAMQKWGFLKSAKDNMFANWTFIGIPYCNGDFHSGAGQKEYTGLDEKKQAIYYNGYTNYQKLMKEVLKYIDASPEQLLITGSSAGGFGTSILADDVIDYFPNTNNVTVHIDSSLLINEDWHNIMVNEWHTPEKFSDVVIGNNITLDSLVALYNKRGESVKILFDCSIRDYNLSQVQKFFDMGSNNTLGKIGKEEGDRFQKLLKKMVEDMQTKIPSSGIFIWDDIGQKEGHLTVHTATGTKVYFDKRNRDTSISEWLEDAVNGNVKSYGLDLLDKEY